MNNVDKECLGFSVFIQDGIRVIGCRGIGDKYKHFYDTFLKTTPSHKWVEMDFPWDYFTFTDINDEQKFFHDYQSYIDFDLNIK
jgi:hypothetical protein